jgi:hypothetical protein
MLFDVKFLIIVTFAVFNAVPVNSKLTGKYNILFAKSIFSIVTILFPIEMSSPIPIEAFALEPV